MNIEELTKQRLEICKACPLWEETSYGPICSNRKWINKEGKVSYLPKKDYVKGCGCKLLFKTKNSNLHCIVNLW